jgi:hypothetical protein
MTLDVSAIRNQFPALNRPDVFFDNPMLRVGAVHYNSLQEVERLKDVLLKISKEKKYGTDTAS